MGETFYSNKNIMADFRQMSKTDFLKKHKYEVCEEDYDETARMDKDIRAGRTMENAIELAKLFAELNTISLLDWDDYCSTEVNDYIAHLAKDFEDEFDDEYLVDHPYSELIYEWGREKLLEAYGKKEWLVKIAYSWGDEESDNRFRTREEAWEFALDAFKTEVNETINLHPDDCLMYCKTDKEKGEIILMYPDNTQCKYTVCKE